MHLRGGGGILVHPSIMPLNSNQVEEGHLAINYYIPQKTRSIIRWLHFWVVQTNSIHLSNNINLQKG